MNVEEFESLVFQNQGIIWKVCRTFFRDEEDQKDLFQDILLNLWKGKENFLGLSKLTTWMYRVSLNQAIDKSRKSKIKTTELNSATHYPVQDQHGTAVTNYDIEALKMAIERLNPIEKAIIHLHLEQESYKNIAEIIGISEKNAGIRIHRIKAKLKVYYEEIIN